MSDTTSPSPNEVEDFGRVGFIKTFVLPAFWLLAIPLFSLAFFLHAESQLVDNMQIRWGVRIAIICIASAVVVLLLGGASVLLSLRSQKFQLYSLAVGWHVLRVFGACQVILQGILVVGLSFWITALWFNIYVPKLIILAIIAAAAGVCFVIAAIFKKPDMDLVVEGEVITPRTAMPLWDELRDIAKKVGTAPPDQIVAGIDDSFFVTEQPITVGKKTVTGRTLYVSLSLLKQLDGSEADAVMAHEMAHFSGNDTVYSKKIAPMMARFDNYLAALYDGLITKPVFNFMLMFRGLYELSLGRQSRQREFRADGIAAKIASPEKLGSSLLRIIAYAKYRSEIETELFEEREALVTANILNRIEHGFGTYAASFVGQGIAGLTNSHPFDSHPPLEKRLEAVGVSADRPEIAGAIQEPGDGRWYHNLAGAAELEKQQWEEYEDRFRKVHEQSLCYRYLPSNDDERELVERHFPPVAFESKKGTFSINVDTIEFEDWEDSVPMSHVDSMVIDDGVLCLNRSRLSGKKQKQLRLKMKLFGKQSDEVLGTINNYFSRYKVAEEQLKQQASSSDG